MKKIVKNIPLFGPIIVGIFRRLSGKPVNVEKFTTSAEFWENRYSSGGNSGSGSYSRLSEFKAEVINSFLAENAVKSVFEFGCGDGNQLGLINYPNYVGFDVSESAVAHCREKFKGKDNLEFKVINDYENDTAELTLSLDVIYHLVEDETFENYMQTLFNSSERHVIVYSSDFDDERNTENTHVRHRKFTSWVKQNKPQWELKKHLPNKYPFKGDYKEESYADFYFYLKG